MSNSAIFELIEKIASAVVLAEADNSKSLQILSNLLEELMRSVEKENDSSYRPEIELSRSLLEKILTVKEADRETTLAELSGSICKLQQLSRESVVSERSPEEIDPATPESTASKTTASEPTVAEPAVAKPAEPEPTASEPTTSEQAAPESADAVRTTDAESAEQNILVLEEWVEESILQDFLSSLPNTLEMLEGDILAIDKGDLEQYSSLLRVLHTLKGDSGALGLQDLAKVCHGIEDYIDKSSPSTEQTDLLLQAKDWIELAAASYAEMKLPVPPSGILQKLSSTVNSKNREDVSSESIVYDQPPQIEASSSKPTASPEVLEKNNKSFIESPAKKSAAIRNTIRVDLERVDTLVEMIGELVIVESMISHAQYATGDVPHAAQSYFSQLKKISRDLQKVGIRLRMIPVRGVFQKMVRIVRDTSNKCAKQIEILLHGENTEMDRSMVEQIHDPLIHLIRNAVDHGIESADKRRAAGKPEQGTILLSAFHQGSNIIIEISDDGQGFDQQTIRKTALAKGFIKEGENPSDSELYQLLCEPGFSTATDVTEISGRGVGLDVVKKSIEALHGRLHIESIPGQGATFRIFLPLTLAIIDGMTVRCGNELYIIPTLSIIESIKATPEIIFTMMENKEMIKVRDKVLPLYRLHRLLDIEEAGQDATSGLVMIIESLGQKVGLLVDEIISQQQVVIKKITSGLSNIELASGAAILSDGLVGLILNVDQIVRYHKEDKAFSHSHKLAGKSTEQRTPGATGEMIGLKQTDPAQSAEASESV